MLNCLTVELFLKQNLQNRQNLFSTGKVANWLLSGGEAVAEPHPFIIEVLHCFVGFVINTYSFFNASAGFVRAAFKVCQRTDKKAINIPRMTATAMIQP